MSQLCSVFISVKITLFFNFFSKYVDYKQINSYLCSPIMSN